ncbi:hypothetical protein AAVH_10721 [Aphelenchoides avenae]|nr:hypothetical protein AAVH_10721 [Aphelenchus avenae]
MAPVFTVFTPTNIFIGSTFLGIRLNGLGCLVMAIHAWTAIINPLSTLLLVENFRKRILRPFASRISGVEVTATPSQTAKSQH